ncbi:MAG TPA: hypothetical protein VEX15_15535 [Nocardioidaceae bacterium]|nr:hypothetical protein [Nocardioidaceae bacterium]
MRSRPAGYVLRVLPDDIDALRFVRLLDRAAEAAEDEAALLSEALEMWGGPPFDGLESDWLVAQPPGSRSVG